MELSRFALAYVVSKALNMNRLKFWLNHKLKVVMFVCPYSSYQDMYDTTTNVEQA